LPLIDETGEIFTFSTTSRGGTNALAELDRRYGSSLYTHPNDFPVVEIQAGTYQHSNPHYGRIKFPMFKAIGWSPKSTFFKAIGGADDSGTDPGQMDTSDERVSADDFSDEVPF
jgi:hypothetical protein